MNILTPEQIKRNKAFIKDLRANPKKAIGQMRDNDGGRCCLCVALDTALAMGFQKYEYERRVNSDIYPPPSMAKWYGWPSEDPHLGNNQASVYNDGGSCIPELSHSEIADRFEEAFPEIKE